MNISDSAYHELLYIKIPETVSETDRRERNEKAIRLASTVFKPIDTDEFVLKSSFESGGMISGLFPAIVSDRKNEGLIPFSGIISFPVKSILSGISPNPSAPVGQAELHAGVAPLKMR